MGSAVFALQQALLLKLDEILANRDFRDLEKLAQLRDGCVPVLVDELADSFSSLVC